MNNLNRRQYASSGKNISVSADYFSVTEDFTPGSTSIEEGHVRMEHSWYRLKASAEQYFGTGWYRPGYMAEVVVFEPTILSKLFWNHHQCAGFFSTAG